jgi:1,4-dihydroxy-2-naphthoate octaprenyltransferase
MSAHASESPLRIWLAATRPRTLPAAVAPVLVGSALAWNGGFFRPLAAVLCLGFALLAQIAANFANDYFDFVKGADTKARVGPRRAVAAGLVSPSAMRRATLLTCVAAFLLGLGLVPFGGWPLVIVGVTSLLCAVAYTGGPYPLGYHGLGDLFVFIFFGLVAVCATFYVQAELFTLDSVLCAVPIGLLAVNILVANNYRDAETDREAGKRTLVVRFGRGFAKGQFVAAHLIAFAVPDVLLLRGYCPQPLGWIPFILLGGWAFSLCRRLTPERSPSELIAILAQSGLYLAAYAIALSLWLIGSIR